MSRPAAARRVFIQNGISRSTTSRIFGQSVPVAGIMIAIAAEINPHTPSIAKRLKTSRDRECVHGEYR
ncbi:hypothetical protein [Paraburkholderia xenovorans]